MENASIEQKTVVLAVKPRLAWGPVAALVVSLITYVVSQFIVIIPLIIIASVQTVNSQDIESIITDSPWISFVLSGISSLGLFAVLWVFLKSRKASFKDLGFKTIKASDIGWLALATIVYFVLLAIAISAATLVPGFDAEQQQDIGGFQSAAGWQLLLSFMGLVILPPLAEEMMFRGFMYRGLASRWPKVIAALTSSLLFALVHFQWNVGVDVFVLSLVLIALYEKTKNLWMCVALHAIKNMLAFLAIFVFSS